MTAPGAAVWTTPCCVIPFRRPARPWVNTNSSLLLAHLISYPHRTDSFVSTEGTGHWFVTGIHIIFQLLLQLLANLRTNNNHDNQRHKMSKSKNWDRQVRITSDMSNGQVTKLLITVCVFNIRALFSPQDYQTVTIQGRKCPVCVPRTTPSYTSTTTSTPTPTTSRGKPHSHSDGGDRYIVTVVLVTVTYCNDDSNMLWQ